MTITGIRTENHDVSIAVDTATPRLSLAAQCGDTIVSWTGDGTSPNYAGELVPRCAALLRRLHVSPRSIAVVVVNRGPGSFTGLRIGMTFVRTVAAFTGARVYAADTFGMLLQALHPIPASSRLIVVCSAVQREVYLREFRTDDCGRCAAGTPVCETVEQFRTRCARGTEPVIVIDASDVGCISDGVRGRTVLVQRDARHLFGLRSAHRAVAACVRATRVSPEKLSLLYIRPTYY